jgi:hypothetical protein
MAVSLSSADRKALETLTPKLDLVRDRVRGVVRHLNTGLYLWGEGGTSKSYTVLEELKILKADYILHNSRMTGRGLVDTLKKHPTTIHVLEDCESMFDDRRAWGVLRSALWSQSSKKPPEREVSWTAFNVDIRFVFTGGLIMIANRSLEDVPELRAIRTRIATLQLIATFPEVAALMRSVALRGYEYGDDYMTPAECLEVAEHIIDRMGGLKRSLDMRIFINGLRDYIQHKTGHSKTGWQDLIETRLKEMTLLRERRADVMQRERSLALEISQMPLSKEEKERLWRERTKSAQHPNGKSIRAYYRRLKELE